MTAASGSRRSPRPARCAWSRSCAEPACSSCQSTTSRCTPGLPGPCAARRRAPGRTRCRGEWIGT